MSFNILAERLGRTKNIEHDYQRLEGAVQHLLEVCATLGRSAAPTALHATGTVVDRIYPFLLRLQQTGSRLLQVDTMVTDLHGVLQRQHDLLSHVEHRLVGSLALAKDLAVETIQIVPGGSVERASGSIPPLGGSMGSSFGRLGERVSRPMSNMEAQIENRSSVSARINSLFDQQISLLEEAKTCCAQARDLSQRCMSGTRLLSQRLREAG